MAVASVIRGKVLGKKLNARVVETAVRALRELTIDSIDPMELGAATHA